MRYTKQKDGKHSGARRRIGAGRGEIRGSDKENKVNYRGSAKE